MTLTIHHRIPREDVALGVVVVHGVSCGDTPPALREAINGCVAARDSAALSAEDEARRKACRDMLRNGKYKPTGRGKPASEYLLRAAAENDFLRINGLVDANNLISLKYMMPISLWDTRLAASAEMEFRCR